MTTQLETSILWKEKGCVETPGEFSETLQTGSPEKSPGKEGMALELGAGMAQSVALLSEASEM